MVQSRSAYLNKQEIVSRDQCVGPNAKGVITGTIIGDQVRWSWLWVTYAGNSERSAGTFVFTGTLRPDNSITGMVGRLETGSSLNFAAKRQFEAAGAPAVPTQQQPSSPAERRTSMAAPPQPSDQELEQMSLRIFNPAGNYGISADTEAKRQQWLYDAKQSRIRNQIEMMRAGHDYSIEWRNR